MYNAFKLGAKVVAKTCQFLSAIFSRDQKFPKQNKFRYKQFSNAITTDYNLSDTHLATYSLVLFSEHFFRPGYFIYFFELCCAC